jgi:hypothetical protein
VTDLNNISAINDSFSTVFRLYLFWEVIDLNDFGLDHLAAKARASTEKYSLARHEVEEFLDKYNVPEVSVFNKVDGGPDGVPDIRIYGGFKGHTLIMWNQGYRVTCRERFELEHFPFDSNDLSMDLRLNDPITWDLYDLQIDIVQFNKIAIYQTEYELYIPVMKAGSPSHKAQSVIFQASRKPRYYIQNIVMMMFALSSLGLLSFVMDIADLGDRVATVLTVILTAVAFKFIIDGALPKVPYNTVIDYYILGSTLSLALMAVLCVVPSLSFWGSEDTQWYINFGLGWGYGFIVIAQLILWLIWAKYVSATSCTTKPIHIKEGKNWYSYRYHNSPYLKEV